MLPRPNRLPLRTELNRLKIQGKMVSGNYFSLLFVTTDRPVSPRFSFIVSKKIDRKAVVRNRIRRLLSEAIRSILPSVKPGVEGVFLVKRPIVGKELGELDREVKSVFQKENLCARYY